MMATAVAVDSPVYGCAENGVPSQTTVPSSEWLKHAPRGAYTTARTVNQKSVFELSFHVQRLAETARLMSNDANGAGAPVPEELVNVELLRPKALATLKAAIQSFEDAHANHDGEMRLTMLTHWEDGKPNIAAHVSAMPARARPPIKVQVKGAPRSNAAAKDSEWVRERQSLEDAKPSDVNEIVLVSEDGSIYEGLSSNFFAVKDGKLYTAGEGILLGTVRHIVLQVCEQEGIPVELTPPKVQDASSWEGCMVTSTSRLCLPVCQIETFGEDGPLTYHLLRDGLVNRIEKLVMQAIEAASEAL